MVGPQSSKPKKREIWLVNLDPTIGSEIQKTRPCLVVSPDEMNRHLRTIIVTPMTSSGKTYPYRVPLRFDGVNGQVAVDQIRTISKQRLIKRLGKANQHTAEKVSQKISELFR